MFDSPRRRKRRRLIWPALVTIGVAVGVLVASAGGDTRSTIAYLEDVRGSAADLELAGQSLRDLVGDLSRVDRSEFQSVVSGVDDALAGAADIAAVEPPDQALVGAATLFRLGVESWQQGITGFSSAILTAADDPNDQTAVDDLASAVVLVRAGDRIYDALIDELARSDVPSPVGPMPDVRLLPVDTPITILAPAWVEAARSEAGGLALRPSVRIEQVKTEPEWVTSADGDVVIEATDTINVMVVVSNTGNTEAEPGNLKLTMATQGADPLEETEQVPAISAGANTS
ncbi:MAG TPA: hypothetical protein VE173_06735, partial [Longimicrobiales bacterium]|nr:hypothetical protein [Longimicrobiales bacterium]